MKREILFGGKDKETLEWVYGFYYQECGNDYIIEDRQKDNELNRNIPNIIISETVCEYTTKSDKNNVKIFEKDIVQFFLLPPGLSKDRIKIIGEVKMKEGCFGVEADGIEFMPLFNLDEENELEVIGNVIDNPELLNKVDE